MTGTSSGFLIFVKARSSVFKHKIKTFSNEVSFSLELQYLCERKNSTLSYYEESYYAKPHLISSRWKDFPHELQLCIKGFNRSVIFNLALAEPSTAVLIHSADPPSRMVVIIVFARIVHPYVRALIKI